MSVREREDAPNSDISPVPVSELVDERTENLWKPKPTKYQKQIKKRPRSNGETCVTILRFRNGCKNSGENLVDDEIPLQGRLSTPVLLMKFL